MARSRHPEQTIAHILDAAQKLFLNKGYENTSIQDIINEVGNITKGAIYHHFPSKQALFVAVNERFDDAYGEQVQAIAKDKKLSGQEKLRGMLKASANSNVQLVRFSARLSLLENPKLLASLIEGLHCTAPTLVTPVIEQCIKEKSISVSEAPEAAELILFILNTWLNPMLFQVSQEQMLRRLTLMETIFKSIGLDILDEEIKKQFLYFNELYNQHQAQ